MKFIHCADLHLGSSMESSLPSEKAKLMRAALAESFPKMLKYASENSISLVLIAGDMFDAERVSRRARQSALACIKDHSDIDFLYLAGNHDGGFSLAEDEIPENLKLFPLGEWTKYRYGDIVFCGTPDLSSENMYDALSLDENDTNIVVLHGQDSTGIGVDKINLKRLKGKSIDYLALGHVHARRDGKLDRRGKYAYSGCLIGRGFDECGEHGFLVIDAAPARKVGERIESEFHPLPAREFVCREYTVSGEEDAYTLTKNILESLSDLERESLVKLILVGSVASSSAVDITRIEQKLSEEFFFAKAYDHTEIEIGQLVSETSVSLCGEFIRLVGESRLKDEEKKQILRYGVSALRGEEID